MATGWIHVAPRDLFNYATLFKCMGKVAIAIHDGQTGELELVEEYDGEAFVVGFDSANGELYLENYSVLLNDEPLELYTPYNSRRPYPLLCRYGDESYDVLDEQGNFILNLAQ